MDGQTDVKITFALHSYVNSPKKNEKIENTDLEFALVKLHVGTSYNDVTRVSYNVDQLCS